MFYHINSLIRIVDEIEIIIFVLTLIYIVFIFKKSKKTDKTILFFVLLMILWRMLYQINTSRYASFLIFSASYFASQCLITIKKKFLYIALYLLIILFWTERSYSSKRININIKHVSEAIDAIQKKNNVLPISNTRDSRRIDFYRKSSNSIKYIKETDYIKYISNYKNINNGTLFNININRETDTRPIESNISIGKCIFSVYYQNHKKKKHVIYHVKNKSTFQRCNHSTLDETGENILKNGDIEIIDSPEESYKKLTSYIKNYSTYIKSTEARTPYNAYFRNTEETTRFLPYYNVICDDPIFGKHSAVIRISKGVGYFVFQQKIYNGKYDYSFYVKGKKDTKICVLFERFQGKKTEKVYLGYFTIQDTSTTQINSKINIQDLANNEYILVGVWVQNGEAVFDNFSINRVD